MGNRAYIQIDSERLETPIVLYGHWSGDDNLTAVKNVLERTDRIGDKSYLTAQIFYEFAVALGSYTGDLGFGIDTGELSSELGDVDTVYVNADTGEYKVDGKTYTEFVKVSMFS